MKYLVLSIFVLACGADNMPLPQDTPDGATCADPTGGPWSVWYHKQSGSCSVADTTMQRWLLRDTRSGAPGPYCWSSTSSVNDCYFEGVNINQCSVVGVDGRGVPLPTEQPSAMLNLMIKSQYELDGTATEVGSSCNITFVVMATR